MKTATNTVEDLAQSEYKYGFVTDIEVGYHPAGFERRCHSRHFGEET